VKILPTITPDEAPFEHPNQTVAAKVRRVLKGLNGGIIPVEAEKGENLTTLGAHFYLYGKELGYTMHTAQHNGTLYIWKD